MLKSYILIVLRSIKKKPIYTFVNLVGLAIGVACAVFIAIFVWDEIGFDDYHQEKDRVYRVVQTNTLDGEENRSATIPFPVKDALLNEFPAFVNSAVRFFDMESPNISIGNIEDDIFFREENFFFVDEPIFDLFDIPLLRGDAETVLSEPNSVVITPKLANRYFGDEDPVGKQLAYEGRLRLNVTGVMEEWPRQSHFRPEILASFSTLTNIWRNYDQITAQWLWAPTWTYLLLEEGTDPERLEEQLADFADKYYSLSYSENEAISLQLQPLTDIYLYSNLDNEIRPTSSYLYILIFSIVGGLILIIACINYINLSTAKSVQRSKEVGLRKTMGAHKQQLMGQFLFESGIYSFLAILLSAGIFFLAAPYFSQFTGKEVALAEVGFGTIILLILVLTGLITLAAGFYPALFMSGYSPVDGVRGTHTKGKKGGRLRRSLVLFQFSITAVLLVGTALAYFQYQHMQNRDMGFDREHVVVIPATMSYAIWDYDEIKERFLTHSAIQNVSGTKTVLGSDLYFTYQIAPEGFGEQEAYSIAKLHVEQDFLETMNINLIAGRDFSEEFSTDREQAVLINREMVDDMEWGSPEEALNKTFRFSDKTVTVVGVTENFHFGHLRYDLEPLIMELPNDERGRIANISYFKVRLGPGDPAPALDHMKGVWDEYNEMHPFDFFFLDSKIDEMYTAERQFSSVMGIFTILAILIGSLGLLGLASYSVSRRTKEIGIRKSLGATAPDIFKLLSKETVKLILIAHAIALPIVYLLARYALDHFPYSINLYGYMLTTFLISLGATIIISLLTISSHAAKAALINPVESLQQE